MSRSFRLLVWDLQHVCEPKRVQGGCLRRWKNLGLTPEYPACPMEHIVPIPEHTRQIIDQLHHQNGLSLAFPPPPLPTHTSKSPEEPTRPHGATRLDNGRRLQG